MSQVAALNRLCEFNEETMASLLADATRYRWLRIRMSGKDVPIFAMRPAGEDEYCELIDAEIDNAMLAAREK